MDAFFPTGAAAFLPVFPAGRVVFRVRLRAALAAAGFAVRADFRVFPAAFFAVFLPVGFLAVFLAAAFFAVFLEEAFFAAFVPVLVFVARFRAAFAAFLAFRVEPDLDAAGRLAAADDDRVTARRAFFAARFLPACDVLADPGFRVAALDALRAAPFRVFPACRVAFFLAMRFLSDP